MLAVEIERENFDGLLAKCQIHQYFPLPKKCAIQHLTIEFT